MKKTITILIGNSDDKLTQRDWSLFVLCVGEQVSLHAEQIHFSGTSLPHMPWQNAAWVCEIETEKCAAMVGRLIQIRKQFRQDSLAWVEGSTALI